LTRAVALIMALMTVIHTAGAASRTRVRDRRRAAGRRARALSADLKLRTDEAKPRVLALTAEVADLAELTAGEAAKVLVNARRCAARQGSAASGRLGRGGGREVAFGGE
jgi:IS5 family transposase